MLPAEMQVATMSAAREVLDRLGVAARLEHVRQFVWRGGTLSLRLEGTEGAPPAGTASIYYELEAHWDTAVLEPVESPHATPALVASKTPVIEGRWTRTTTGYVLRAGIDLGVPSAIFIRSERWSSFVPFV